MADTRTPEQRRRIMQSVGQKDTKPELIVRRLAHSLGYRYRLYRKDLPGTPDLVFPRLKTALFVHGCFWHGHGCAKGRLPKTRTDFWREKIERNMRRDAEKEAALRTLGWKVASIWQCETRDAVALEARLRGILGDRQDSDRFLGATVQNCVGSPIRDRESGVE